jgi:hypothetical protein
MTKESKAFDKLTFTHTERLVNIGDENSGEMMEQAIAQFRASNMILAAAFRQTPEMYRVMLKKLFTRCYQEGLALQAGLAKEDGG